MKIQIVPILLTIFLTACAPVATAMPIATATITPKPTHTNTPEATKTATAIPTATEIPVGAFHPKFPEAGPRPEGAAGIDPVAKEWVKSNPEHPDKPFHWKTVTDPKRNETLTQGWYENIIVNSGGEMKLITGGAYPTSVGTSIWCEEGLQCPSIEGKVSDTMTSDSFPPRLMQQIYTRISGKTWNNATMEEKGAFLTNLGSNGVDISFTTARGDQYVYNTSSKIQIYISKKLENPDISKGFYKFSIRGDNQHNLNVVIEPTKSMETMSHHEVKNTIFDGALTVFFTDDLSLASILKSWTPGFSALTGYLINGSDPYLTITP
jgi:hypothetical protein